MIAVVTLTVAFLVSGQSNTQATNFDDRVSVSRECDIHMMIVAMSGADDLSDSRNAESYSSFSLETRIACGPPRVRTGLHALQVLCS